VLQSLDKDARKDLTPIKLREKAAKFSKSTVKIMNSDDVNGESNASNDDVASNMSRLRD